VRLGKPGLALGRLELPRLVLAIRQPHRDVDGLEGLADRGGELVLHRRQVDRIPEPAGEGGHRRLGVIASTVEAPVDGPLDPLAQRVEQHRGDQRRGRHAHLAGKRQNPGGQRHDADVHADDEPGDQRVRQRAADDPVDLVQPELQDADAESDRQGRDTWRDQCADDLPAGRGVGRLKEANGQAGDKNDRATIEPLELQPLFAA
jgi:hypothetical protein